jgi:hypothetical protein
MNLQENKNKKYLNNKGAAALLTVIIVSAAVLVMAYSASVLGLGELDMGYTSQRGAESFSIADGCMEEALRRIKINSSSYSGSSLSLGGGSCIISVSGAGSNRTITVSSTISSNGNTYGKKIQSGITLSGDTITVSSWNEI